MMSDADCQPISDYGVIGDSRSIALVSSAGAIDWCCWPRFDSPAIFSRLLDRRLGGYFSIRPIGLYRSSRAYVGSTNLLATTFVTPEGTVELLDLMPALTEAEKRRCLLPYREILRRIRGVEGVVDLEVVYVPRLEYGRISPRLERRGPHDVCSRLGNQLLHLRADVPLTVEGDQVRARVVVRPGERHYVALAFNADGPSVYPSLGEVAEQQIVMSLDYWRRWSAQCLYTGPGAELVLRSALVLKLLAYAPSGGIIAAPTTSLPEVLGGERNWDYRYVWLRDASFTVDALLALGFRDEGAAFAEWLLYATAQTHPAFQVLYTVFGNGQVPERRLEFLGGYCDSRPVRVGNRAYGQFQLDVYGEVLRALRLLHAGQGQLDSGTRDLIVGMANLVATRWREPDNGIWEFRAGRTQTVHGKVMAWVALNSAIEIAREAGVRADLARWTAAKEAIRATVLQEGFNSRLASFVATLNGNQLDASLLRLPRVGFIAGDDPRMVSTIAAVRQSLAVGDLVYRYRADDGLAGQEGAFFACSFWLVSGLALAGQVDQAHALFERLLARANDLGLYSEEIEPTTGRMLGNFPQALSHVALINAALTLQRVRQSPAQSGR